MFDLAVDQRHREAQYCPQRGQRLAPRDGQHPAPAQSVAVVVFETGESVALFGDTVIGRDPSTHRQAQTGHWRALQVDDATAQISRTHLLLRTNGWELEVVDLGARNGSYVALADEQWHRLMPGAAYRLDNAQRIRIGARQFTVHPAVR